MSFESVLQASALMLTEGSMYERLRRQPGLAWDPDIAHSSLIYDEVAASVLKETHREYIEVARDHGLPMLVGAATWRANRERVSRSAFAGRAVNADNINFVRSLCEAEMGTGSPPLYVSAGVAPRGDAYRPAETLDPEAAVRFHSTQVDALVEGGPDVLMAMTLPAVAEARGISRLLEATELPYVLSFVIRDDGTVLDGTPLGEAFDRIDQERGRPPLGYFINCVHPAVIQRGLGDVSASVRDRLIGFRANAADRTPEELEGAGELLADDPVALAERVASVRSAMGLKIVGGCCGAGTAHTHEIARHCARTP